MATVNLQNGQYVWSGTFAERLLPKEAKFRWDPQRKVWWTDSAEKAAALLKYAAPEAAEAIRAALEKEKEQLTASAAVAANIYVPAPQDLAYLPYQLAGIAFALQVFGDAVPVRSQKQQNED